MNKCPNCGYIYNDNDAFCAMCGIKFNIIDDKSDDDIIDNIDDEILDSKEAVINNINSFESDKTADEKQKVNFRGDILNNTIIHFVIIIISICIFMCGCLYLVIKKQDYKKLEMRFNNMMSNPQLIPELREPNTFLDLKTNLKNCENFLGLYLRNSKDAQEKKEQVFISYLIEMEKLPHITNENIVLDDLDSCSEIKNSSVAQKCAAKITKNLSEVGISAYSDRNTIFLYPDYRFIYKKYSKLVSDEMEKYLKLKAKYPTPVNVGLTLYLKPRKIADKIYDFEKIYTKITDVYIRDEILKTIYKDFRVFIFSPSIYATTTKEMTKEFKDAYLYFISMRKNSQLRPVVMSYMDKMRSYTETNFINDYPYKTFDDTFNDNVKTSALGDIFVQLRKRLFTNNSQQAFLYVYNTWSSKWDKYQNSESVSQGEYIFAAPDDNNVTVYNNTFSLVQELNIPKYSKLFLANNSLYVFNSDRLSISKIVFNGKQFSIQFLHNSEVSSIFPGIQVINIDSYQNYNIYVEKDNKQAFYIILSKYSQGFDGYKISSLKGNCTQQGLVNMFSISTDEDVELSFHNSKVNPYETSDSAPTYKIYIHTRGSAQNNAVVNYDEKTANEGENETYNPTIMPKIMKQQTNNDDIEKDDTDNLSVPPSQNIDPPDGD